MLWRCSELSGYEIAATDGTVGSIDDLLFDEVRWTLRWAVADTGGWLSGRKVLLPASALGRPDAGARRLPVTLSRAQVEASPPVESDLPVSRQVETDIFAHYGAPPYWESDLSPGGLGGGFLFPPGTTERLVIEPGAAGSEPDAETARMADADLRSVRDTVGYAIAAQDGRIGHVEDFLVDEAGWPLRYMVVDTRHWLPGRKVLVAPQWIRDIDWAARRVTVELSGDAVRASPEYDSRAPVGRSYEATLHGHYGRKGYWGA
ncbi:MAG TPA: PRC-barrel domain-containing protein [Stellaceae bacterium]|nr:PRC-barrel domain-containing protein [Stellaceae bacterium]